MTKRIIYGVGLFIVFLMGLGLLLNYVLPLIGIDKPLASLPILISFWFCVVFVVYLNRKWIYINIKLFSLKKIKIPPIIYVLICLPIMAVVGAELVNYTSNNIVLMVMLPLIVAVPIICMFTKFIPQRYWAFAIWMMSLSIILHRTLISPYLAGADNIIEMRCFYDTYNNGIWANINAWYSGYNTVASVTVLPVMVSKITFISGIWIFKLVFPLFLSLVPVAVYELIKTYFTEKIAFLSSFLFMSVYIFFTIMIMTDKQLIATVLFAVFFLMLFDKNNKLYLLGLLALGVILAHYGTAILFIGLIIGYSIATRKIKYIVLSVTLFIIGFVWYRTQNSGIVANQVTSISQWVASTPAIGIGSGTIADVHSTFGNMIVRMFVQGVTYLPLPLLILYVISQVLIVAGFIIVSWRWILKKVRNISIGYMALALMSLGLLALELLMKQLANIIGIERIYLFCLMFLAPFVFVAINKFKRLEIVAVLFVGLFFLLNVGFINQVGGKPISNSIALNPNESDYPIFTSKEIEGANWLVTHTTGSIYTDTYSQFIFYYYNIPADDTYRVWSNIILFDLDKDSNPIVTNELSQGSYIYLRKFNIEHEEMTIHYFHYNTEGTVAYSLDRLGKFGQVVETAEIVYQNSDCKVLRTTIGYKAER